MRVFNGFLIVLCSTILILLPITAGAYDFRTDLKEDIFRVEIAAAVTVANLTLIKPLYDDDISTVTILSDDANDAPVAVGYHTATRVLDINGLIAPVVGNHTLTVSYDVDALGGGDAIGNVMDKLPWIWLILIFCFPVAAVVAILLLKRS